MTRRVFLLATAVLLLIPVFTARAYNDDSTHYELTREAVDFYSAYSGRVFSSEERETIARGAVDEDFPPRWVNHFYDPVHNEPWLGRYGGNVETGDYAVFAKLLTGQKKGEITPQNFMKVLGPAFGISKTYTSKDWSQNEKAQSEYSRYKGNRTLQRALYEYTNGNKKEALYTLGFILHLIEDATVPDHTRGDTHKENSVSDDPGSPYEKWAERLTRSIDLKIAEDLASRNEKVISVQNLNQIFDLAANYSNRNFFSEDTIFEKRFTEPKYNYLGDGYFGVDNIHLFKMIKIGENKFYTTRDNVVMQDYWNQLSPMAVKAGAGIMEYFFKEVERIEKEKEKLKKPETAKFKMISPLGELTRLQQQAKTLAQNVKQAASTAKNKAVALAKQITQTISANQEQKQGQVLGESTALEQTAQTSQIQAQPPIPAPVYRAALASAPSRQISTHPSADYSITVAYKNEGNAPWPKSFIDGQVSLNIVGGAPAILEHPSWLTGTRPAVVSRDINPAQQEIFNFSVKSPSAPGSYSLALRPVIYEQGRFEFLGGAENQFSVTVTVVEEPKKEPLSEPPAEELEPDREIKESNNGPNPSNQSDLSNPTEPANSAPATTPLAPAPAPPTFIIIHGRDNVPPQASMVPLAASQTASDFLVSWQGQDNQRDGQVFFDIQYQTSNGDWLDWLSDSRETSATFSGVNGNTYGFRCRGRDNEGNATEYPAAAETSTYVNTRRPDPPQVTSHTNGQTLTSLTATLSGTAEQNNLITINLSPAGTIATTTADELGAWSAAITLSEGANSLTFEAQEADGDISDPVTLNLTVNLPIASPESPPASEGPSWTVVINEIAWMGTGASANDEWLELYNNTDADINLAGWTLEAEDGTPGINLSGTIAAQSYFLLERTDDTTISDIAADQIYTGASNNEGELLILRDAGDGLIDQAGTSTMAWFAGDNSSKQTMERKDTEEGGASSDNWASNDSSRRNGQDALGGDITGTPKAFNSVNTNLTPSPDDDEEEDAEIASVDQAQTLFNTNTFWGWNGRRALQTIAQTFIPNKANLSGFNFRLCRNSSAQTALAVYLCAGEPVQGTTSQCAGGIPLWSKEYTVAETQTLLSTCSIADQPPVINFNFDPIAVTPGNTYSFVFRSSTFNYSDPFISCYQANTNPYADGQMWYTHRPTVANTTVATFATTSDWYFETIGAN